MSEVDPEVLRATADTYVAARRDHEAATAAANAAYDRLQASPETLEYQIDWNLTRRAEAAAAYRLAQAERAYRQAGGYLARPGE